MFPPDVKYDDRDRLLLVAALFEFAGNPDKLEPGSDTERVYELLADLATECGLSPADLPFRL